MYMHFRWCIHQFEKKIHKIHKMQKHAVKMKQLLGVMRQTIYLLHLAQWWIFPQHYIDINNNLLCFFFPIHLSGTGGFLPGVKQIANVAALPGIVGYSVGLPDVHAGYGFAIGMSWVGLKVSLTWFGCC